MNPDAAPAAATSPSRSVGSPRRRSFMPASRAESVLTPPASPAADRTPASPAAPAPASAPGFAPARAAGSDAAAPVCSTSAAPPLDAAPVPPADAAPGAASVRAPSVAPAADLSPAAPAPDPSSAPTRAASSAVADSISHSFAGDAYPRDDRVPVSPAVPAPTRAAGSEVVDTAASFFASSSFAGEVRSLLRARSKASLAPSLNAAPVPLADAAPGAASVRTPSVALAADRVPVSPAPTRAAGFEVADSASSSSAGAASVPSVPTRAASADVADSASHSSAGEARRLLRARRPAAAAHADAVDAAVAQYMAEAPAPPSTAPAAPPYSAVSLPHAEDRLVSTPYGLGTTCRTERRTYGTADAVDVTTVLLTSWEASSRAPSRAGRRRPTLHAPAHSLTSAPLLPGTRVRTAFGRGFVRAGSTPVAPVVELTDWRLAGRSAAKIYLGDGGASVHALRPERVHEMDPGGRVRAARALRETARGLFVQDTGASLRKFREALALLRAGTHKGYGKEEEVPDHVRADTVECMVTCSNNAAACIARLVTKHGEDTGAEDVTWAQVHAHAHNALLLLDALERKKGNKVMAEMLRGSPGLTATKLFGEYRAKSLLLLARAETAQGLTDTSKIKRAVGLCEHQQGGTPAQMKEAKRMLAVAVRRRKSDLKKEKEAARAMFGGKAAAKTKTGGAPTPKTGGAPALPAVAPAAPAAPARCVPSRPEKPWHAPARGAPAVADLRADAGAAGDADRQPAVRAEDPPPHPAAGADDGAAEDLPWYEEHGEALLLGAVALLATAAVVLGRRKS